MADVVNRIVSSSVGLDRTSWQGRERQGKKEKEQRQEAMPATDEVTGTNGTGRGKDGAKQVLKDKGEYLDVNA